MIEIPLTRGYVAIVDDEDAPLATFRWHALVTRGGGVYAKRDRKRGEPEGRKCILLHREVLHAPAGMEIDHINGNTLDNRRSNLRVASKTQNRRNLGLRRNNTTGYKGVCWDSRRRRWSARITRDRSSIHLGRFLSVEEAAKAYDAAALAMYGEFARTNKTIRAAGSTAR